jgi:hypothetical protein
MSDRVCQFFLRGRCQRENCEFKHEKPSISGSGSVSSAVEETAVSSGIPVPVCHLFLTGSCKVGNSCRFRHEKPDKSTTEVAKDTATAIKPVLHQASAQEEEAADKAEEESSAPAPMVAKKVTKCFQFIVKCQLHFFQKIILFFLKFLFEKIKNKPYPAPY